MASIENQYTQKAEYSSASVHAIKWTGENIEEIIEFTRTCGSSHVPEVFSQGEDLLVESKMQIVVEDEEMLVYDNRLGFFYSLDETKFNELFMTRSKADEIKAQQAANQAANMNQMIRKQANASTPLHRIINNAIESVAKADSVINESYKDLNMKIETRAGDDYAIRIDDPRFSYVHILNHNRFGDDFDFVSSKGKSSVTYSSRYGDDYELSIEGLSTSLVSSSKTELFEKCVDSMKEVKNKINDAIDVFESKLTETKAQC